MTDPRDDTPFAGGGPVGTLQGDDWTLPEDGHAKLRRLLEDLWRPELAGHERDEPIVIENELGSATYRVDGLMVLEAAWWDVAPEATLAEWCDLQIEVLGADAPDGEWVSRDKRGRLHCGIGPAIERINGTAAYWFSGRELLRVDAAGNVLWEETDPKLAAYVARAREQEVARQAGEWWVPAEERRRRSDGRTLEDWAGLGEDLGQRDRARLDAGGTKIVGPATMVRMIRAADATPAVEAALRSGYNRGRLSTG